MNSNKKLVRLLTWLGVALLQLIGTQVVTFLVSFLIPGMGDSPQIRPVLFAAILGITFSAGIFLAGWLALKLHWLVGEPRLPARLVATLIGAYLPLCVALIIYHSLEAGNPFFFISILAGILGFTSGMDKEKLTRVVTTSIIEVYPINTSPVTPFHFPEKPDC